MAGDINAAAGKGYTREDAKRDTMRPSGDVNAAAETILRGLGFKAWWNGQEDAQAKARIAVAALVAEVERLNERLRLRDENRAVMLAEVEQWKGRFDESVDNAITLQRLLDESHGEREQLRAERDAARKQAYDAGYSEGAAIMEAEALRVEKQQLEARLQRSEEALVKWVAREQRLQEALREITEIPFSVTNSTFGQALDIARAALAATDPLADE